MIGKRGQIWIETVIYTLIALVLIGLVLAFVTPKVEEYQDRVIIEQTIELMNNLDDIILSIGNVVGNQRIIDVGIKKGTLIIDGGSDNIRFELESMYEFSEPGEEIDVGGVSVLTERAASVNVITLTKEYEGYDLKYNGEDEERLLSRSSTPYKISISNTGTSQNKTINFAIN